MPLTAMFNDEDNDKHNDVMVKMTSTMTSEMNNDLWDLFLLDTETQGKKLGKFNVKFRFRQGK